MSTEVNVGITGGRDHRPSTGSLELALAVLQSLGATHVHHGGCRGVDTLVAGWFETRGLVAVAHPPDLDRFGSPAAYHVRNQEIVDAASVLLVWPGGRGTRSTVDKARRKKIPRIEFNM